MMDVLRPFDPWKSPLCTCPRKYSLHPYTGCSHLCLYCYATSYIGRKPSTIKRKFLQRLKKDLKRADPRIPVELSTSSDPYPPEELSLGITRESLELLRGEGFRVLITTKGVGFVRDEGLYQGAMVTITTLDKELASKLEPRAPSPDKRLDALSSIESRKGVRIDPIIPFLTDDIRSLKDLIKSVRDTGAEHIVFSTYKAKPDNFKRIVLAFPEMSELWRSLYYKEGEKISGYRYLKAKLRYRILKPLVEETLRLGMTASVCREGFPDLLMAPSCDGTHLLF